MTIEELLRLTLIGEGGRIVSTNDLTNLQISDAKADQRMCVNEKGYGWVFLPWSYSSPRDLERERDGE